MLRRGGIRSGLPRRTTTQRQEAEEPRTRARGTLPRSRGWGMSLLLRARSRPPAAPSTRRGRASRPSLPCRGAARRIPSDTSRTRPVSMPPSTEVIPLFRAAHTFTCARGTWPRAGQGGSGSKLQPGLEDPSAVPLPSAWSRCAAKPRGTCGDANRPVPPRSGGVRPGVVRRSVAGCRQAQRKGTDHERKRQGTGLVSSIGSLPPMSTRLFRRGIPA